MRREQLPALVRGIAQPGDIVICLGAGTITQWAYALPGQLAELDDKAATADDSGSTAQALLKRVAGGARPARAQCATGADLTWFRAGGPAEVLFTPADEADLARFLAATPARYSGLCDRRRLQPSGPRWRRAGRGDPARHAASPISRRGAAIAIRAGAAALDVRVARFALDHGICGLTFLRGIPGTIGGALRMNGGAYGGETKDVLVEARAVDRMGNVHVLSNADMHYTYRHCGAPEDLIFTRGAAAGRARRSGGDLRGHGRDHREPRGDAADQEPHRRLDLQESARPQSPGS